MITVQDVAGNFLASTGVLAATQTLGANASYRIDGGPLRYSTSNAIIDAVPSVTLSVSGTQVHNIANGLR